MEPAVSQFLMEWEDEASEMCYQATMATWNFITNLTEYNKNKMVKQHPRYSRITSIECRYFNCGNILQMDLQSLNSKFERASWRKSVSMRWNQNLDPVTKRELKLLSLKRHYALTDLQFAEVRITNELPMVVEC